MANDNGSVIPFKPKAKPSDPNATMIEMFEDYLEAAKEGRITFAAVAIVDNNGVGFSNWEPEAPPLLTAALGAVSFLHFRFNQTVSAGSVDDDSLRRDDEV